MTGDECDGRACGCNEVGTVTGQQRVFVTTLPEGDHENPSYPTFLVHRAVNDKFIDERVAALFGTQGDGSPHEWAAYDEPADA